MPTSNWIPAPKKAVKFVHDIANTSRAADDADMDAAVLLAGLIVAVPLALSLLALVAARLSQPDERYILKFAMVVAGLGVVAGVVSCGAVFEGDSQSTITIRNETPWPIEVTGDYGVGFKTLHVGQEQEFDVFLGPGIESLAVGNLQLRTGPELTSLIVLNGDSAAAGMTIVVRSTGTESHRHD